MQAGTGTGEQGLIRSTYQQTIQALDSRIQYFQQCHISNEAVLADKSIIMLDKNGPRSLCEILPSLANFTFAESPVQPSLRDLYTSQYDQLTPRCVLPPPSEGQNSINENDYFEPSFSWLCKTLIDSTHLTLDQIQPRRQEKNNPAPQWENVTELLIHNISNPIHKKSEVRSIEKYLNNNFSKYPWAKIKRIREIYYKGKPSILLRFYDQKGCSFAYYNFWKGEKQRKNFMGMQSQVSRVIENRLKTLEEQKWVGVIVRKLPFQIKKEVFVDILRKKDLTPIWVEELIEIQKFKYTLCKIGDLEQAFQICSFFQLTPPFKETRINLHPKSAKIWKRNPQQLI